MNYATAHTYEGIFNTVGFGIVDTSFIRTNIETPFFQMPEHERLPIIQRDIDLYDALTKVTSENITFPEETVSEFADRTDKIGSWIQWHQIHMPQAAKMLSNLYDAREYFSRRIMITQPTESHLSEKSFIWLPHIEKAIHNLSANPLIAKKERKRLKRSHSLTKNRKNDNKILAKSHALALQGLDTCILIGDGGITDKNDLFGKNRESFGADYGFPINPNHHVDTIYYDRKTHRFHLYTYSGHEDILHPHFEEEVLPISRY